MKVPTVLVVVRDPQVRSLLAPRLELAGCMVASADRLRSRPVRRMLRRCDWLVVDDGPAIRRRLSRLCPFRIVLLTDGTAPPVPLPGCFVLPRQNGVGEVVRLIVREGQDPFSR